ncbi:MAG: YgiQ family radical SAM protein [Flavobacteriales bacterium]
MSNLRRSAWLPITKKEMKLRDWEALDVVLVTGDAYVDHPSFGSAVIGRIIESEGFRVGIIPQPNWRDDGHEFMKFGAPKHFFAVTGGNMDPMVNHYTANKRRRSNDAYTPNGESGFRPDYATTVYTKILKELYPDVPVLIGGIEASLRRVTHYDYWADELMPSIMESSGADLLVYGMGEQPLREILRLLKRGVPFESLKTIKQTAVLLNQDEQIPKNKTWVDQELNAHELCLSDKLAYASNFKYIEQESNKVKAKRLIQNIGDKTLVINPPYETMTEKEMDQSYDLPFTRLPHPKYNKRGAIPAFEMIKHSLNIHRGCFGGCSFCTISAHQGKFIASRSEESILNELDKIVEMDDFKGYLSDIGGPSANMYKMKGYDQSICDRCQSPSCIHPVVCSNLDTSHKPLLNIYKKVNDHPKIKKAFIGSGIRYDLLTESYNKKGESDDMDQYLEQVMKHHVSGRLKVAPEHTSDRTLKLMRKPSFKHFHQFKKKFDRLNEKLSQKLQLIPYFISSHPATEQEDMANLAAETKEMGFQLEQVQDFTPTPMTVSTVIYYSGHHPYNLKKEYTPKTEKEKKEQNRFFFWYKSENQAWISKVLKEFPDLKSRLLGEKKAKQQPKTQREIRNEKLKSRSNKKWKSVKPKAKSKR